MSRLHRENTRLGQRRRFPLMGLLAEMALIGCITGCHENSPPPPEAKKTQEVTVVRPVRTSLFWTVQQPAYIEAFEETPIVPKIAGYVQKWNVDIGDCVEKGQALAVLWVPDMVAEHHQRTVEVQQARKLSEVAEAHLASSRAQIEEAKAGLRRARADADYCRLQHDRITQLTQSAVVNKQVKDESWKSLESAQAGVKEAEAKVVHAEADVRESEAAWNKSRVDIAVAQAAAERMKALLDYSTLPAPFDGVVTRRNINTGDFVKPPNAVAEVPLYVVQRRDLMRVFVEIPEADAVWVKVGTPARIRVPILRDKEYCATVKRMAYSLKRQSRTLLAEIDLPNPEDWLRPGMYAYATIRIERKGVVALPVSAVATRGSVNEGYQDFCFLVENAKVWRVQVEVGSRGDSFVQVLKKQSHGAWSEFSGEETVVRTELANLADGQEVVVAANESTPATNAGSPVEHKKLSEHAPRVVNRTASRSPSD